MVSFSTVFPSSLLLLLPVLQEIVVVDGAVGYHRKRILQDMNIREIPYPYYRFKLWENVDTSIQTNILADLNYTEEIWNTPGSALVEEMSWENIVENRSDLFDPISSLGFQKDVWDCYHNHYGDYFWPQLEELDVSQYWEAMGWTAESWEALAPPPETEELFWDELSEAEQEAATLLCYNIGSWNYLGMPLWPELPEAPPTVSPTTAQPTPSPSSSPSVQGATDHPSELPSSLPSSGPTATAPPTNLPSFTPTTSPTSSMLPPSANTNLQSIDAIRYVLWDELDTTFQDNAKVLGYTNATWNLPGSDPIELFTFDGVSRSGVQGGIDAINAMGMDATLWDCHINHFGGYEWDDLGENQILWKALGWSESSWSGIIDPPPSNSMKWDELTERQQDAVTKLCYRQESWDYLPLSEWGAEEENIEESNSDGGSLSSSDPGDAAATTTKIVPTTCLLVLFTSGIVLILL